MKKIISSVLAFVMLLSAVSISGITAYADEMKIEYQKNPYYEGAELATGSTEAVTTADSVSRTFGGHTYYTRGKQLYRVLCSCFENRKSSVKLYYLATAPFRNRLQFSRLCSELFSESTDDSVAVTCTDGDYARWAVSGYGAEMKLDNEDGYYFYTLTLLPQYYDTAEQEKQVNTVVNSFVSTIDTNSMTDYEIIKKIHDFICEGTSYCYDAVEDTAGNPFAFTAYGALVKGSCVCQGYAVAFYRLCRELGYTARVITSTIAYVGPNGLQVTGHAWNLVGLNDKYYYVDPTWDDENMDTGKVGKGYDYFLVSYAALRKDDTVGEHTPDEKYYDGTYYNNTYGDKIDEESYNSLNPFLLSNCVVSLDTCSYTYNSGSFTPNVSVASGFGADIGSDYYTVTYSSNKNAGVAKVNVVGQGLFEGSSSHRQFTIIPPKASKPSLASGGRAADSVTLSWSGAGGGVTGYIIERYAGGVWSKAATTAGTYVKISSLSPATKHTFRIRAYKTVSKRNLYGAYSDSCSVYTKPKKPVLSLKSTKKAITASWKRVSASGYELQCSTSKKFDTSLKKYELSSGSVSKKITRLKSKKRYYVRVRAFKTVNGKKIYSAWSAVKSLKCK